MLHFPNYFGTGYAHSSSTAETPKQTVNTRIDCSFWSFYSRISKIQTLTDAVLTSTHNLCFEQKYEKYQNYYLKFFIFVVNIFE